MLRETTMPSVEHLKQLVRCKLEAAAEEICAVFHRVIVDYEEQLARHRKLFDAAYKPVVKSHRTVVPQQVTIKEEVIVEDQAPLNQDKNSSQDQEEPEPPQLEEQQEEESSPELRLKQEPEELQLCSAEVERNKSEDQNVPWHSEESDVKMLVITAVGSETNSDLQLCSPSAGVSPIGSQTKGYQEFDSQCVSPTGLENPGLGSSSCGSSLQHQVMRKKYVCRQCGRRFSDKSNLNRHERMHTGEKLYVCETCGKRYSAAGHLKLHKLIHTGEKPYACDTCDMRFMRPEALKIHKTIHSAQNQYVCQECGRRFAGNSALGRHKRTHTGEKPHVCYTCNKRFSRLESLKIHTRIHTGERPYVCSHCGKGFFSSAAIRYHLRTTH